MNQDSWLKLSQRTLTTALDRVRMILQHYVAPEVTANVGTQQLGAVVPLEPDPESALGRVCKTFNLSLFERDVLLLCAGFELDSRFAPLCSVPGSNPPTFRLALAALTHPHWEAIAPHAPLRYWRLIEVGSGSSLMLSPLRIDERILNHLIGLPERDERLTGWIEPLEVDAQLLPVQQALAEQIAKIWGRARDAAGTPIIQLTHGEPGMVCAVVMAACHALGLKVFRLREHTLPVSAQEVESLAKLWSRESALSRAALIIESDPALESNHEQAARLQMFIDYTRSPLVFCGRTPFMSASRPVLKLELPAPSIDEQRAVWQSCLGPAATRLNDQLDRLITQFQFAPAQVQAAVTEAQEHTHIPDEIGPALWSACRRQARPRLDHLGQHLEALATWDDLVLPEKQKAILHEIATHVRQRDKVYSTWGFRLRSVNGLGITALFAGDSGTGKTMAAEVLANELQLDLYRIDLSQVVSKYVGETEKNLKQVFDAAETGGVILLFDEADALFGKRSDIKDSHDRYANIEVSYLLQRMEAYRGLAVLTTNMKNALDSAFSRRLRFIVHFPFPDAQQRVEIWKRIFPPATPTKELDFKRLSRLNIAGGSIRNIALNAAFLAADESEYVQMTHLLQAARSEYSKLEKPLTDFEVKDWVGVSEKR